MEKLLNLVAENGGKVISADKLSPEIIEMAINDDHFYINSNGHSFIYVADFEEPVQFKQTVQLDEVIYRHMIKQHNGRDNLLKFLKRTLAITMVSNLPESDFEKIFEFLKFEPSEPDSKTKSHYGKDLTLMRYLHEFSKREYHVLLRKL